MIASRAAWRAAPAAIKAEIEGMNMHTNVIMARSRNAAAAGLFKLGAGQAAKAPDPIFAAIERFDTAWKAAAEAHDLGRRAWAEHGASVPAGESALAGPWGAARRKAAAAMARLKRAEAALVATRPTTLGGVAAALELVAAAGWDEIANEAFLDLPGFVAGLAAAARDLGD